MLKVRLECDYRDDDTPLYKKLCLQINGMYVINVCVFFKTRMVRF